MTATNKARQQKPPITDNCIRKHKYKVKIIMTRYAAVLEK